MTNLVSTWFYVQGQEEGGRFAQISENSASEEFRDIYRRCIGVFFASARRANPDARLVLYLNKPWDDSASRVSRQIGILLSGLRVEMRVISYDHVPPPSFTEAWRNQFFVIDVLKHIHVGLSPNDVAVILDSDVVWTSAAKADEFWDSVHSSGLASYQVGYDNSYKVNGLSIGDLQNLMSRLNLESPGRLTYCGGEIVGGTADGIETLFVNADRIWSLLMDQHLIDTSLAFEEAHVLSMAYACMGHEPGSADRFIRRLWTQPLKPRNVAVNDTTLALWHVPAEKKYGLARLYRHLVSHGLERFGREPDSRFRTRVARQLGIPKNSIRKVLLDVCQASLARLRKLSRKYRN
ncbi:hypothetical protein JOE31_001334 [Arthrobacter sp. PvP023]|uniref:hypothetical protein n=1 Tax=Micrococcaceae TaxID=1268 RepID=UPI001AE5161F|nr:hypothetical protein [Arthrobacter sp. PvP023]MBP1135102.1 hypothetical protein [Arthrobacter sp. PvP023]